ncbi:Gryzun, putative trafficking through Golgi [Acrodontium crateriforme]|uniref:Gryzun, putative trafficking through Golgi n=1 Tax=Acrodontium crateriforme TaxID=150365 RepID=A0AAQ3M1J7_9PEZI|nr:Gryzun, putative trafficking through Golgi [Acrodontium crateriforme]
MDAFPREYVEHNLPLLLLSGLGEREDLRPPSKFLRHESGARIETRSPICGGEKASQVLEQFFKHDGSDSLWNANALPAPPGPLKYRIKAIGRSYALPPRKAAPLPQSPGIEGLPAPQTMPRSNELHSPLSPLVPGSPCFPDGVFTPLWLAKHEHQVPACLLAFFDISVDDSTAQNEQIQIDINAIRTALSSSGFKIRFSVVLMSDKSIIEAPQLEDRLSAIRRATTLDPKTGLFFMPPMSSSAEIDTFVRGVLVTVQPLCIEYYRDLTKHARRKKVRGGPPASAMSPIGRSSQTLSTPGWNVRYEIKQGVFAEFRQEMDVAERHYSAAIEELFNIEGIFETTPIWSPRWDEARLLCDSLAIRVLRCQLFNGETTGAAVSFFNYQARMKDLLDRRGKGSQTYSWSAWESRMALVMSQLIQRAGVPAFRPAYNEKQETDVLDLSRLQIFAPPEKPVERLLPFRFLHHPGYWQKLAINRLLTRRERAKEIPEEDRTPPGQSPASSVAKRPKNYDWYLVPEPHEEFPLPGRKGYEYLPEMMRITKDAAKEFELRSQTRMTERLRYDMAVQLFDAKQYQDAMKILTPLWEESTWRRDEWRNLFSELLLMTSSCAEEVGDSDILLSTRWELLSSDVSVSSEYADFAKALDDADSLNKKIEVKFQDQQKSCPVKFAFAFESKDGHVGEPVQSQLIMTSCAMEKFAPLCLSTLEILLNPSKIVKISHAASTHLSKEPEIFIDLSNAREDEEGLLLVKADLTLFPQQTRIFNFNLNFKEAQTWRLEHIAVIVEVEKFKLEHILTEKSIRQADTIVEQRGNILERRFLPHADTTGLIVLQKPPKLQLVVHHLQKTHYTDEYVKFEVEFANGETEAIDLTANISAAGETEDSLPVPVRWASSEGSPELTLSDLSTSKSQSAAATLVAPAEPGTYLLHVDVNYTLASDPTTAVMKTLTVPVTFTIPFEAKFNLGPRLQPGEWPSFYSINASSSEQPSGIKQRWRLESEVLSLATESLHVKKLDLTMDSKPTDAICELIDSVSGEKSLSSQGTATMDFEFVVQRMSLDDRRPTALELSLEITWSRDTESKPVVTIIPIPRLTLPSSEPRVLCTVVEDDASSSDVVVQYSIENPSTHFLTFALTMDASEDFAFSGPKHRTLSLVPLSRRCVEYRFMVHDLNSQASPTANTQRGVIHPLLQVLDSYYQRHLKVHPGGPGVTMDKESRLGISVKI